MALLVLLVCSACADGVTEPGVAASTAPDVTAEETVPPSAPVTTGRPSPATEAPPDQPEARRRIVIHGVGDVNLDPTYIPALAAEGYAHAWSGLDGLFLTDDLTVINLECAVSDLGVPLDKLFTFRCDPDALPHAADAGVEVASLANNHGQDFGTDALLDSVTRVSGAGIHPVGVGANADEAGEPAVLEIGGWRIAVVGFGGVVPATSWIAADDRPGMRDGDDIPSMVAAVEEAAAVADIVVVTIHWGVELDTKPRADDVERARAMVAAGADVIFGHHSHRLNPLEFVDGRPVAWGLGNFVWPRFSVAGSTTAVARVVVEPDGRIGACLIPADIVSSGHPVLTEPECVPAFAEVGVAADSAAPG